MGGCETGNVMREGNMKDAFNWKEEVGSMSRSGMGVVALMLIGAGVTFLGFVWLAMWVVWGA